MAKKVLVANDKKKFDANTWIADSDARSHMCKSFEEMFDLEDTNFSISVGDGMSMSTATVGKFSGHIVDSKGNCTAIVLTNVTHVPELMVNLISLTAVMEKGGTKKWD